MPRIGRIQSGTGIYHVMLRGINRQDLFEEPDDYWAFIRVLSALPQRKSVVTSFPVCTCHIYAYCLMPNHVHLLVCEKDWKVGEIVKSIASSYAFYYNKKYGRVGHLFQDRFRSEPISHFKMPIIVKYRILQRCFYVKYRVLRFFFVFLHAKANTYD